MRQKILWPLAGVLVAALGWWYYSRVYVPQQASLKLLHEQENDSTALADTASKETRALQQRALGFYRVLGEISRSIEKCKKVKGQVLADSVLDYFSKRPMQTRILRLDREFLCYFDSTGARFSRDGLLTEEKDRIFINYEGFQDYPPENFIRASLEGKSSDDFRTGDLLGALTETLGSSECRYINIIQTDSIVLPKLISTGKGSDGGSTFVSGMIRGKLYVCSLIDGRVAGVFPFSISNSDQVKYTARGITIGDKTYTMSDEGSVGPYLVKDLSDNLSSALGKIFLKQREDAFITLSFN